MRAVSLDQAQREALCFSAPAAREFSGRMRTEACLVPVQQPSKCHSMAVLHWHVQSSCTVGEDDSERVAGRTDGSDATLFVRPPFANASADLGDQ